MIIHITGPHNIVKNAIITNKPLIIKEKKKVKEINLGIYTIIN